jgi:hypothetical protein
MPTLPSWYSSSNSPRDAPCQMFIEKSVAATLAELLDIPLSWTGPCPLRQKITGVSCIWMLGQSSVTGSFGVRPCLALGNGSYHFTIRFNFVTCFTHTIAFENTLEQLLRFCCDGIQTSSLWQVPCPHWFSETGTSNIRTIEIHILGGDLETFKLCLGRVSTEDCYLLCVRTYIEFLCRNPYSSLASCLPMHCST